MSKVVLTTLLLLVILSSCQYEQDKGAQRLNRLKERSMKQSNRVITFNKEDFSEYVMKYPRPYDVVIYFTAKSCKLCTDLFPEYEYTVELYDRVGAIESDSYPTFFVQMIYNSQIQYIYEQFGFTTAPNIVVSKPYMAVVSQMQRKTYLQQFKWSISYTDGHVTTHKLLQFVNKRTAKDVQYKPLVSTMFKMFFGFILVAVVGAYVYTKMQFIWNHWVFWLIGSLVVFITCCSGIVYDIIHDVPFVGKDQKTGETIIFSDGNREQYGLEGWIVSITITLVGALFVSIVLSGQKLKERYSLIIGFAALIIIYFIVGQLEGAYKSKSWYGPSFYPPEHYLSGPLSVDQGNNI